MFNGVTWRMEERPRYGTETATGVEAAAGRKGTTVTAFHERGRVDLAGNKIVGTTARVRDTWTFGVAWGAEGTAHSFAWKPHVGPTTQQTSEIFLYGTRSDLDYKEAHRRHTRSGRHTHSEEKELQTLRELFRKQIKRMLTLSRRGLRSKIYD